MCYINKSIESLDVSYTIFDVIAHRFVTPLSGVLYFYIININVICCLDEKKKV